jgi:hypothetical protein
MRSKLLVLSMVVAGALAFNAASAQVQVTISEREYPGYSYYTYPAWHGHYRDHAYYAHYHARFYREHRHYFAGGHFDHDRFERENHWHAR